MVFSSVTFLFFFLPAVITLYYLVPRPARNGLLLAASLVFYTWGTGALVLALIASIAANYIFGLWIERFVEGGERRRAKVVLAVAVLMNVALLGWFKYANFAIATFNGALGAVGRPGSPGPRSSCRSASPSTRWNSLSYLIDIFRGVARHLTSVVDFALYITFFPQLVAGPIVRFHEIRDQLVERVETSGLFCGRRLPLRSRAGQEDDHRGHRDLFNLPELASVLPEFDNTVFQRIERSALFTDPASDLRTIIAGLR